MKTDKGRSMVLRKLKQEDAVGMLEWMQDEQIRRNFRFTTDKKRLTQTEVLEFIDTADYVFRVVFERGIQDVKVVWNIKRRVSAFRGGYQTVCNRSCCLANGYRKPQREAA